MIPSASEQWARVTTEEMHRNGGDSERAWQTCMRTHKSVYEQMMAGDARRRADLANADEKARKAKLAKAALGAAAIQIPISEVLAIFSNDDWQELVGARQDDFLGKQASEVFGRAVKKLEQEQSCSYDKAWARAKQLFPKLYSNMV